LKPLHVLKLITQIKPLTEEEKKAKLAELKAKMLVRKAEQAEKERQEAKANEVRLPSIGLELISDDPAEERSRVCGTH